MFVQAPVAGTNDYQLVPRLRGQQPEIVQVQDRMDRSAGRSGAAEGVENVLAVRRDGLRLQDVLPVSPAGLPVPLADREAEHLAHRLMGNKDTSGIFSSEVVVIDFRNADRLDIRERRLISSLQFIEALERANRERLSSRGSLFPLWRWREG